MTYGDMIAQLQKKGGWDQAQRVLCYIQLQTEKKERAKEDLIAKTEWGFGDDDQAVDRSIDILEAEIVKTKGFYD